MHHNTLVHDVAEDCKASCACTRTAALTAKEVVLQGVRLVFVLIRRHITEVVDQRHLGQIQIRNGWGVVGGHVAGDIDSRPLHHAQSRRNLCTRSRMF